MPDNPYPDAATVEAVRQTLGWRPEDGAHISTAIVGKVLAAARRVEQEQARTRFSRVWTGHQWNVRGGGDGTEPLFSGLLAFVTPQGGVTQFGSPIADLRALAAYVEAVSEAEGWGAPGEPK